jgi:hypothetical protein
MDVAWAVITESFVVAVLALILWIAYRWLRGHRTPQH